MGEVRIRIALALFFLLCASAAFADVNIDIGAYSISNPKITVNYTQPVFLYAKSLVSLDPANPTQTYPLCQIPAMAPPDYFKSYNLFTIDNGADGVCTNYGTGAVKVVLIPGRYLLSLTAVDSKGQQTQMSPVDNKEFTITGILIKLVSPSNGFSRVTPYTVFFTSNVSTVCRYSFTQGKTFDQMTPTAEQATPGLNHNINNVAQKLTDLYVLCQESTGRQTPAKFIIGYDNTPPNMTVNATPQVVVNPNNKYTVLHVTTDDNSTCTYQQTKPSVGTPIQFPQENPLLLTSYTKEHEEIIYYNDISSTDRTEHNYSYSVKCTNLAALDNTSQANVTVNFGLFKDIEVIDPPEVTNQNVFTLKIRPTYDADACTVNAVAMTKQAASADEMPIFTADFGTPTPLQNKKYIFNLRCTGANDISRQYNVTVDTVPPSAPTINASDVICDNKVSARFNTTDNVGLLSYTYTLRDDSGVLNTSTQLAQRVTVELTKPVEGALEWTAYATDLAGNDGAPTTLRFESVHAGMDEECGLPPFITLQSPPMGFAIVSPYTFGITSLRSSDCRYALQPGTSWTTLTRLTASPDKLTHTKTGVTYTNNRVYVACNETADGTIHRKSFLIGVDGTSPKLSVRADPNPVADPYVKASTLSVTTDDLTFCTYNGTAFGDQPDTVQSAYTSTHLATLDYSLITDPAKQLFPYDIVCKNLAGLQNTTQYEVVVYLGAKLVVDILSPPAFTANDSILLQARPNKQATCVWQESGNETLNDFTTVEGMVYSQPLGNLPDGSYEYKVTCTGADGEGVGIASFTVDRSTPTLTDLSGPKAICLGTEAVYSYNVTSLDPSPIISYSLDGPSGGVAFAQNTTNRIIRLRPTGVAAGNYTLSVKPITHAGIEGTPATMGVAIYSMSDDACNGVDPNHCTNGVKDPGEEDIDCGGTCAAVCIHCAGPTDCTPPMVCKENVCVNPPGCALDSDCATGEVCTNHVCVPSGECRENSDCPTGHVCVAGACVAPALCTKNSDCATGYICVTGVCTIPHCANNKKDSDETGVDCGGSCPTCVSCPPPCGLHEVCSSTGVCVSTACTSNNDCPAGKACINGACSPIIPAECPPESNCLPGDVCVENVCKVEISHCARSTDCNIGEVCVNGICKPVTRCTSNANCGSDRVCVNGICILPAACTASTDCNGGYTCVKQICALPHCSDQTKNNDETGVDCGGSCPLCVECPPSNACTATEVCDDSGVCVSKACTENANCSIGRACIDGACVLIQQEGCTSDQECGDSEVCTDGTCTPIEKPPGTECQTDEQCALGELCVEYTCQKETPIAKCETDSDCKTGQTCVNNVCKTPPAEKKSYLLAILFIVFGIAIMGGAGYFLYQQNEEKKAAAARRVTTAYAKPGSMGALRPMNPELEAKYAQERAARQKALQEEYAKRTAEKEAQRKSAFAAFKDSAPVSDTSATTARAPTVATGGTTPAKENAESKKDDDGFVELNAIKKPKVEKEKTDQKGSKQSAKKDDTKKESSSAFDELDRIGK